MPRIRQHDSFPNKNTSIIIDTEFCIYVIIHPPMSKPLTYDHGFSLLSGMIVTGFAGDD